jgi:hypothetical protein
MASDTLTGRLRSLSSTLVDSSFRGQRFRKTCSTYTRALSLGRGYLGEGTASLTRYSAYSATARRKTARSDHLLRDRDHTFPPDRRVMHHDKQALLHDQVELPLAKKPCRAGPGIIEPYGLRFSFAHLLILFRLVQPESRG